MINFKMLNILNFLTVTADVKERHFLQPSLCSLLPTFRQSLSKSSHICTIPSYNRTHDQRSVWYC